MKNYKPRSHAPAWERIMDAPGKRAWSMGTSGLSDVSIKFIKRIQKMYKKRVFQSQEHPHNIFLKQIYEIVSVTIKLMLPVLGNKGLGASPFRMDIRAMIKGCPFGKI